MDNSSTNLRFSVIIPTYNGASKISNCINSLSQQSFLPFEIIIVIDGSTDNTKQVVSGNEKKVPIKIIDQQNKGRAGARNTGAKIAKGDYLVFFDDDVVLQKATLSAFKVKIQYSDVIVGSLKEKATDETSSNFAEYCSYLHQKWDTFEEGFLNKPYITANNFLIKKSIFMAHGMFNEKLSDAEDFELAVRLFEDNIQIYYSPSIVVEHELFKSFEQYIERQIEYRKASKSLLEVNPLVEKYYNPGKVSSTKKLVYAVLRSISTNSIFENRIWDWFPNQVKFYFFSKLIFSRIVKND
ncbi:MAG: glycosyltransferase family A protein [Bacteroidota bacterium]